MPRKLRNALIELPPPIPPGWKRTISGKLKRIIQPKARLAAKPPTVEEPEGGVLYRAAVRSWDTDALSFAETWSRVVDYWHVLLLQNRREYGLGNHQLSNRAQKRVAEMVREKVGLTHLQMERYFIRQTKRPDIGEADEMADKLGLKFTDLLRKIEQPIQVRVANDFDAEQAMQAMDDAMSEVMALASGKTKMYAALGRLQREMDQFAQRLERKPKAKTKYNASMRLVATKYKCGTCGEEAETEYHMTKHGKEMHGTKYATYVGRLPEGE